MGKAPRQHPQGALRGIGEAQELGAPPKGTRNPPKIQLGTQQCETPLRAPGDTPKVKEGPQNSWGDPPQAAPPGSSSKD